MIRFLLAEKVRPSEIHQRLVAVYGKHVMNIASVQKWCTMFRNGRTDVHDAERSGRPSVITDTLKHKLNRIVRENRHFTISEVNICNTAKFVHVGPGGLLVQGGNK